MNFGPNGDIICDETVSVTDIQAFVNLVLSAAGLEDDFAAVINGDGTM